MEIYVIYWGRNSLHLDPLSIKNSIVWFENEADAVELTRQLNDASERAFYSEGSTYTRLTDYTDEGGLPGSLNYYPVQYSWRKLSINDKPSVKDEIFTAIEEEHYPKWKNVYEQDD